MGTSRDGAIGLQSVSEMVSAALSPTTINLSVAILLPTLDMLAKSIEKKESVKVTFVGAITFEVMGSDDNKGEIQFRGLAPVKEMNAWVEEYSVKVSGGYSFIARCEHTEKPSPSLEPLISDGRYKFTVSEDGSAIYRKL